MALPLLGALGAALASVGPAAAAPAAAAAGGLGGALGAGAAGLGAGLAGLGAQGLTAAGGAMQGPVTAAGGLGALQGPQTAMQAVGGAGVPYGPAMAPAPTGLEQFQALLTRLGKSDVYSLLPDEYEGLGRQIGQRLSMGAQGGGRRRDQMMMAPPPTAPVAPRGMQSPLPMPGYRYRLGGGLGQFMV